MKFLLIPASFLICHFHVYGQIQVSDLSLTYEEDFNTLPINASSQEDPWLDNFTLPNWYAENETLETLNIRYGGTRSTGGSSNRGMYSFGDRNVPDMALGVIATNSSGDITFGIKYENVSGETIESVTVSYIGEQWRISNGQLPQVIGFSYLVYNSNPDLTFPERSTGYTYVPELYFTSPKFDTTGLLLAGNTGFPLNGNLPENNTLMTFSFNVTIADGEFLLLRWYQENTSKLEFGLAIDDLSVDFSNTAVDELSFYSNSPIYHYISGPIDLRIPDKDDTQVYDPPVTVESGDPTPEESEWRDLIQNILDENYVEARTDAPTLGYELISFYDGTNSDKLHYILRHNGAVDNLHHWGTYIFNSSPTHPTTYLSVPHPVHDGQTGRQGGYLYQQLDVSGIHISGNYRCSSNDPSGCHGTTSVCSGINDFRKSDPAHSTEHPFHYTSEVIANNQNNSYFIQLHGFSHSDGDPDIILSNGTDQTPSGSDKVASYVSYIDNNTEFNAAGVHSDPYDVKLTGYTNTLGRYLNEHQSNICESNQIANSATDRFVHIEQRGELREIESNYAVIELALEHILATILPLDLKRFRHTCNGFVCQLNWQSTYSHDVERIEILGSEDGVSFTKIAHVAGNNTPGVSSYQLSLPNHFMKYYRLKTVDFNGFEENHKIILAQHSNTITSIHPNPFNEYISVSAELGIPIYIYSIHGKLVLQDSVESKAHQISTKNLPSGIYLVSIGEKTPMQYKLIKR